MSHSVVFPNLLKKTTISSILHLFSTIYKIIFQVLKSTFADLLECGEKRTNKKKKDRRILGNTNFQKKFCFSYFGGFWQKIGGFHILQIKKPPKTISPDPFRLTE